MVLVTLRRMTSPEFDVFAKYSTRDYANDLTLNQEMEAAAAIMQARTEFSDMLPAGADTPENALMVIEEDCQPVGAIWYLYEFADGARYVFLSDLVIRPDERRKGYAAAALAEMEKDAIAHGCPECRLYVWNGNRAGLNLYTKCGYSIFRQADDGVYMKKTNCLT